MWPVPTTPVRIGVGMIGTEGDRGASGYKYKYVFEQDRLPSFACVDYVRVYEREPN
jgi:hypothetical protein